jgi:hypothetical protein
VPQAAGSGSRAHGSGRVDPAVAGSIFMLTGGIFALPVDEATHVAAAINALLASCGASA